MWHLDGYDKLKPFGFPIHGAIDGYSRRILWLRVTCTNNDSQVITGFYIQCIRQIGGGGSQEFYVVIKAQKIQLWLVFCAFLGDTRLML